MNWGIIVSLFLFSTVKFMFAPIGGSVAGIPFWETYFACALGGTVGAATFYFSAGFFMKRSEEKYQLRMEEAEKTGKPIPKKKKFTRMNRLIVRIKSSLGIYGVALFAPFILSVPVGSIITAKFYKDDKRTFAIITLGMFTNCLATTGLSYLFA